MSKVSRLQLADVIVQRFGSLSTAQLAEEIAAYLLETGRVSDLESLLRDIMQLRAERGVVEVLASSAHDLSPKDKQDIEAQIRELYPAAQTIIVSEERDATIIGGVRLELANQQLDLSVRSSLNKFKQLVNAGKEH
ncbi:MAG TPA: F0F1 ATP synthase subunit delta [Candidatus Saccharimonadales bacterium]|nr:F0F1 ATP synthase subunit delta [Candidatus Saccharimonadales bacterium]